MKRFLVTTLLALAVMLTATACNKSDKSDPTKPPSVDVYSIRFQTADLSTNSPLVNNTVVGTTEDGYESEHVDTMPPNGWTPVTPIKSGRAIKWVSVRVQPPIGSPYDRFVGNRETHEQNVDGKLVLSVFVPMALKPTSVRGRAASNLAWMGEAPGGGAQ